MDQNLCGVALNRTKDFGHEHRVHHELLHLCTCAFMSCMCLITQHLVELLAKAFCLRSLSRATNMVVAELLQWGSPLPLVLLTVLLQFHPRLRHKQDVNVTGLES